MLRAVRVLPGMLGMLGGIGGLILTSCSSVYVQANVQGYGLSEADLGIFRGFVAESAPDSPNPLRDEAVLRLVAADLTTRGWEDRGPGPARAADEFGLQLHLTIEESTVEVPQQVHVTSTYWPGHTWRTRGPDCGPWITVHTPGEWHPHTWISGGYTIQEFTHHLILQFRDAEGREIWRGELSAHGRSGDLLAVLRACVPALLAEFPAPSGQPAERRIRVDTLSQ